jgi:hypothetical protein
MPIGIGGGWRKNVRYSRPFITETDLDKEKNKNPITSQVENLLDEHYNETFK